MTEHPRTVLRNISGCAWSGIGPVGEHAAMREVEKRSDGP